MICIILNIVTMGMDFEGSSDEYNDVLEKINLFFTSVFIFETTTKIIGLGLKGVQILLFIYLFYKFIYFIF
jgi:hypothetical protein